MLGMISVIAVTAAPTIIRQLRDRRVNRAAMQLVDYYRTARTMAVGRGQPIMVSWNEDGYLAQTHPGGTGIIRLIEPLVTTAAIAPTCGLVTWNNFQPPGTAGGVQEVSSFDIQNGRYDYTVIKFFDDVGNAATYSETCFSPSGRMYLRTGSGGVSNAAFHPVTGVPAFTVLNQATGRPRRVFVPPNGVARLQL